MSVEGDKIIEENCLLIFLDTLEACSLAKWLCTKMASSV